MGLPHAPVTPARQRALDLMSRKDALQAALDAQLVLMGDAGTTAPLVDAEGFPRADIDVWTVRTARVRAIELRNDLRAVVEELHGALAAAFEEQGPVLEQEVPAAAPREELVPFAKVDGVAPGSPAASAGLVREDLILQFGELTASAFVGQSLAPLVQVVGANENRSLPVKVKRGAQTLHLSFTPRTGWGGRGMLGCHIVPSRA